VYSFLLYDAYSYFIYALVQLVYFPYTIGMKQLHIVHIIPKLTIGGAERFVISLCTSARSSGVRHSIVTLWDDAPLRAELPPDVQYHSLHMETIPKWKRVSVLGTLLQSLSADVVHTHLFSADLWGRLAARKIGIPVITTEHNINVAEPWHWRFIKRSMAAWSTYYTVPSTAIAQYVQHAYGVRANRIKQIPHGILLTPFLSIPPVIWSDVKQILIIGRLVPQKGHSILFEALAELDDRYAYTLHVVGDGPLRASLEETAHECGIAERIIWHGALTDVATYYAEADLVVIPSRWEGFGLVALEAMVSARPVVASQTGGLTDIITHTKTGWLVPPDDVQALRSTVEVVFAHTPTEVREVGERARTWATEHGSIDHMADAYAQLYTDIYKTTRS
jgi:glycosyltransferase involved in cell wall biosynthesis